MYCHDMILIRKEKNVVKMLVFCNDVKKKSNIRCLNDSKRLRQAVMFYQGSSIETVLHV